VERCKLRLLSRRKPSSASDHPPQMKLNVFVIALAVAAQFQDKFLIVSSPRFSKISYFKVGADVKEPLPLIDKGLRAPQGLAVDPKTKQLFVADPNARKILIYQLSVVGDVLMADGNVRTAAQNVEARWVAVDGEGNLFFTDELKNVIQRIRAADLAGNGGTPATIYDGATVAEVNRPGGLAVDNFHVFWANKAVGTQVGSVVKGLEEPEMLTEEHSVAQIAKNSNKVYGVCLSQNNVFYTDSQKFLFGVKKNGGAIATVSDRLMGPRGCTWDGDSTVYVADKYANKIISFPGNMHNLAPAPMTNFANFEDAFGLAVIHASSFAAVMGSALAFLIFSA